MRWCRSRGQRLRERIEGPAAAVALESASLYFRHNRVDAIDDPRRHLLADDDRLLARVEGLDHGGLVDCPREGGGLEYLAALEEDACHR